MKLVRAQITNYRSIHESGSFDVENDVTCLVGKNESGKSATLRALYGLRPVEDRKAFDEVVDYPATKTRERKRIDKDTFIPVVKATFELENRDLVRVKKWFGDSALTSGQVTRHQGYRTPGVFAVDFDDAVMTQHLISKLDPTSQTTVGNVATVEAFVKAL
ncbi:AAA family ATPase [Rhodococcus opacus]|uniref:AAA family ATPase n=1 Tax=Rhodococcus opacus TaxID=37919 RepID=UPI0018E4211F|nr:AAA family ATPase [Rhodococcus opacus]